jgi:hypothetical protein
VKKTTLFEKAFKKRLKNKAKEEEDSTYGGGALGPAAAIGHSQSGDFYAPGDYRRPFALGAVQTRKGLIGKKRRRKKKNKK